LRQAGDESLLADTDGRKSFAQDARGRLWGFGGIAKQGSVRIPLEKYP
jgi:hypothetical protein